MARAFQNSDLEKIFDEVAGCRRALERIAGAFEAALSPAPPATDAAGSSCLHPADERIEFGVTNGAEDFQCGLCGYRSVPPPQEG